jgi:predicted secreted hydrolase
VARTLMVWLLALTVPIAAVAQTSERADEPPTRLADLLGSEADAGFARALAPRPFNFPGDHGPHPEFRNEWWYFTGNLDDEAGRRFGFELTFFRFALAPAVAETESAWRSKQVYIAHLALSDAGEGRFHFGQRYSRGALGLAGAQAAPFRVWLEDWQAAEGVDGREWQLVAKDDDFAIELSLVPLRAPVLHGEDGLSQKSSEAGNASYYYSITRLETTGTLRVGDRAYRVSGLTWLDREWSSSALAAGQAGWDWFALQLSDGSDLMFYSLRRKDGSRHEASAGSWISPQGEVTHLSSGDVEIMVLDHWSSPQGGSYPAQWRLRVPRLGLDVSVTPIIPDQELTTTVRYWEGAVDVAGDRGDTSISGRGYVELTGYADN